MTKLEFLKLWSVKARRAYWQWRAANVTKVGLVAAVLFVVIPGAIWWFVRYLEFLAWVVEK